MITRRFYAKKMALIEPDDVYQIIIRNSEKSIHGEVTSVVEQAGVQTVTHGFPPQQFSVRNVSRAFMVVKLAE
jgi:hypothetical protein